MRASGRFVGEDERRFSACLRKESVSAVRSSRCSSFPPSAAPDGPGMFSCLLLLLLLLLLPVAFACYFWLGEW